MRLKKTISLKIFLIVAVLLCCYLIYGGSVKMKWKHLSELGPGVEKIGVFSDDSLYVLNESMDDNRVAHSEIIVLDKNMNSKRLWNQADRYVINIGGSENDFYITMYEWESRERHLVRSLDGKLIELDDLVPQAQYVYQYRDYLIFHNLEGNSYFYKKDVSDLLSERDDISLGSPERFVFYNDNIIFIDGNAIKRTHLFRDTMQVIEGQQGLTAIQSCRDNIFVFSFDEEWVEVFQLGDTGLTKVAQPEALKGLDPMQTACFDGKLFIHGMYFNPDRFFQSYGQFISEDGIHWEKISSEYIRDIAVMNDKLYMVNLHNKLYVLE